jgi:Cysteine-rich CPXCG
MKDEASYTCDSCGEEIVVPIDLTAGSDQEYVEDFPVCCRPNVIHVEIDEDGGARVPALAFRSELPSNWTCGGSSAGAADSS